MYCNFTYREASIRYRDQGRGETVIFLHGYLESLEVFSSMARELAKGIRVITIDLPGHGKSDLLDGQCGMDSIAHMLQAFIDHLQLGKVHLFGHSMGGYAALAFAGLYPDSLKGLCLLHSTPFSDTPEKRTNRSREIALIKRGKKHIICRTSIPNTFTPKNRVTFSNEIDNIIATANNTTDEGIIAALRAMIDRRDTTQMLSRLNIHKTSIIGFHDTFIPFDKALETARETGMHPIVLKSSAHMGFIEESNECIKQILKIINREHS